MTRRTRQDPVTRSDRPIDDADPGLVAADRPRVSEVMALADDGGRLNVTVDGTPITHEPIGRAAFGSVLDELLRTLKQPIQMTVIETDGSRFTDVLTPEPSREAPQLPVPTGQAGRAPSVLVSARSLPVDRAGAVRIEVAGDGFMPGEGVAIAPITSHGSANADGHVRGIAELLDADGEVLLVGRISGVTLVVQAQT